MSAIDHLWKTARRWRSIGAWVVTIFLVAVIGWRLQSIDSMPPVQAFTNPQNLDISGANTASENASAPLSFVRPILKAALRDPFELRMASAPIITPPPAPIPNIQPPVAPPVQNLVHRPDLTFVGFLRAPNGNPLVLAQWGDGTPETLAQGKVLRNGYVVESISNSGVYLVHPQTQDKMHIAVPPAPLFEIR
jgi:hypothetical protein